MEAFLPAAMTPQKGLQECDLHPNSRALKLLYGAADIIVMEFSQNAVQDKASLTRPSCKKHYAADAAVLNDSGRA